jgi:hypothetical protein
VSRASLVVILRRTVLALLALAALLYASDYLLLRYKVAHPKSGDAFGTVQMIRLLAIPMKDGKTDYELDAQQPEVDTPCVHSLFPHLGDSPCWYLQRNSKTPIPM